MLPYAWGKEADAFMRLLISHARFLGAPGASRKHCWRGQRAKVNFNLLRVCRAIKESKVLRFLGFRKNTENNNMPSVLKLGAILNTEIYSYSSGRSK